MSWQAQFHTREEFEAAQAPAGVDPVQFAAAQQAAKVILASGAIPVRASDPKRVPAERQQDGSLAAQFNHEDPTIRIRFGGQESGVRSVSVEVSEV